MWAVGCVAVVLLTGGLAFCDPVTNCYSETLAKECDLAHLQTSTEWQLLRARPRSFVEDLLVLDENARMTADEGLNHSWFSNRAHKADFEDLYQRTIKAWRPKTPKDPVVEFLDSGSIQQLPCSQNYLETINKKLLRRNGPAPMEEPFKPFPRKMHAALLPIRQSKDRVSDEIRSAIDTKWPAVSESAVVLEERINNVPKSRQSPWFRTESTRRLRRVTTSPKAQENLSPPRTSLRSSRSMPVLPFRMGTTRGENINSAESSIEGTGLEKELKEIVPPVLSASSSSRNERDGSASVGGSSPLSRQQNTTHLQSREASESVSQEQLELERFVRVTVEPCETGDVLVTRSESHRLVSVRTLEPSPESARQVGNGTLKRRRSKGSLPVRLKRRRGSVYDLLDDNDSDGRGQ